MTTLHFAAIHYIVIYFLKVYDQLKK